MGSKLTQRSGDHIASSSCPLMLIQGKAAAKTAAFPCLLGGDIPPSPKAHAVSAVAGTTRHLGLLTLNQTRTVYCYGSHLRGKIQ